MAIARGWTEAKALRVFSRRHDGKRLRNGARLRLSERTLRRHLKAWRKQQSPEAFPLRVSRQALMGSLRARELRHMMFEVCFTSGMFSMRQAADRIRGQFGVSIRACYRVLTPLERQRFRQLYRRRHLVRKAELALRAVMVRLKHRLNTFETRRNRLENAPVQKSATQMAATRQTRAVGKITYG
jgi:hypothetical protein